MKKLIWSAFAMSLIVLSPQVFAQTEVVDDFLGLEVEPSPIAEIQGKIVTPEIQDAPKRKTAPVRAPIKRIEPKVIAKEIAPDPEIPDEFLGMEMEMELDVLPVLKGEQKFTTPELHESDWKVTEASAEIDLTEPNKGQGHSIIPWSTQDPEDWLSINTWLLERDIKDKNPEWKIRLRQADLKELAGKILQCKGECEVYRGSNKARVQHLSRILEGDEIRVGKDSMAWIFMMDGSLMRLSSDTSVSINEINFGKSELFILARLNHGHIFWHPRSKKEYPLELSPETDSLALPLRVRESNQQFFERSIFQEQKDDGHLAEIIELDDRAIRQQIKSINSLKEATNPQMTLGTRVMIVTPNSTIVSKEVSFDYYFLSGGKSYFKKRNSEAGEEFSLYLRGYTDTLVNPISETVWHEVEANGRSFSQLSDAPGPLQVVELLTKRIKTVELAREIWTKEFTVPMMAIRSNPEQLAREFGYTSWGDELEKRFAFLVEYTRRIETTNLRSIENLLVKLEGKGQLIKRELSDDQYRASLNHYLLGLKSRYDKKKMRVREMNDLQYYVWILKNGKF
jgi:hypothetical protein